MVLYRVLIHVRGITRSASARHHWEGDVFDAWQNRVIAYDVKVLPTATLLCQMRDINCMSRGNALAINRHNLVPCTDRTSRQWLCNQRVSCL